MFEIYFKLKNETDLTVKVVTMIDGAIGPAVMVLKPNEEMVHFKPENGYVSIKIMDKQKDSE